MVCFGDGRPLGAGCKSLSGGTWFAPSSIFSPKPKVDGTVVEFMPINDFEKTDFSQLEKLLDLSFRSRRKKIKNTLSEYKQSLLKLSINENLRPENLSVKDYCNLVNLIN